MEEERKEMATKQETDIGRNRVQNTIGNTTKIKNQQGVQMNKPMTFMRLFMMVLKILIILFIVFVAIVIICNIDVIIALFFR